MRSRLFVGAVLLFSVAAPVLSKGNIYSDTVIYYYDTVIDTICTKVFSIPVTYFDYHTDGSNPDFGNNATARWDLTGLPLENLSGWADSSLTADTTPRRNPALTDTFLSLSWNLENEFKPWVQGPVDTFVWKSPDSVYYITDSAGWIIDSNVVPQPDTFTISDTLHKNVVIQDSLTAKWEYNSFTVEDTTDSVWGFGSFVDKVYPLKGKGLIDSNDLDNTGYTMSLHNKFTYHGGEIFTLGADDDVYAYINGKLVIEGGGLHTCVLQDLYLDSLNLTVGEKYDIDIFYAERRMGGNIYFHGISDFEIKGSEHIDTTYDIWIYERIGVIPHSKKSTFKKGTVFGLRVPPSSQNVKLEYFSVSGIKCMERKMPLTKALVNQSVSLPQGMYMVRVTFLNAQDKRLFTGSFRTMIVRK